MSVFNDFFLFWLIFACLLVILPGLWFGFSDFPRFPPGCVPTSGDRACRRARGDRHLGTSGTPPAGLPEVRPTPPLPGSLCTAHYRCIGGGLVLPLLSCPLLLLFVGMATVPSCSPPRWPLFLVAASDFYFSPSPLADGSSMPGVWCLFFCLFSTAPFRGFYFRYAPRSARHAGRGARG